MPDLNKKNVAALLFVGLIMGLGIWRAISSNTYKQIDISRPKYGNVMVRIVAQYPAKDEAAAKSAVEKCYAAIDRMESLMSYYKKTSDVGRFNNAKDGENVEMDSLTLKLIRQSQEIYDKTSGAFDITIPPLEKLWKNAVATGVMPSDKEIKEVANNLGTWHLALAPTGRGLVKTAGVQISLNAIAEGCGVDMALDILREAGLRHAMVDAGGEIGFIGKNMFENKPWTVTIRHPRLSGDNSAGEFAIDNKCVSTSGDYEKNLHVGNKKIHHIYDPRTGRPVENLPSVTVIAPNCTTADALATSLTVLGVERGLKTLKESYPGVSAIFIEETKEGKLVPHCTPDLEGKINFTLSIPGK